MSWASRTSHEGGGLITETYLHPTCSSKKKYLLTNYGVKVSVDTTTLHSLVLICVGKKREKLWCFLSNLENKKFIPKKPHLPLPFSVVMSPFPKCADTYNTS